MQIYEESEQSKRMMALNMYYLSLMQQKNPNLLKKVKKFCGIAKEVLLLRKNGTKNTWIKISERATGRVIKDYNLMYDSSDDSEMHYIYRNNPQNYKIAVYTSIFGGYDDLKEPLYKSQFCDYFAITDHQIKNHSIWKKYNHNKLKGFDLLDDYHKAKYCKLFPHILFPEYEYSIWVDGNITIVADMAPLIDRLDRCSIGMFNNPIHDCIFTEEKFVIYYDYADPALLNEQMRKYEDEGMPRHFGMRECSVIARKHKDEPCIALMNEWWEQINRYTMRDQLSLPYLLWKNGKSIDEIHLLGDTWRWNPRFIDGKHLKHIKY